MDKRLVISVLLLMASWKFMASNAQTTSATTIGGTTVATTTAGTTAATTTAGTTVATTTAGTSAATTTAGTTAATTTAGTTVATTTAGTTVATTTAGTTVATTTAGTTVATTTAGTTVATTTAGTTVATTTAGTTAAATTAGTTAAATTAGTSAAATTAGTTAAATTAGTSAAATTAGTTAAATTAGTTAAPTTAGTTAAPTTAGTTAASAINGSTSISTVPAISESISSEECGSSKLCTEEPSDCDPATGDCFFLSAKQRNGQKYDFELSGETEGYIAAGLSETETEAGRHRAYICANNSGAVRFFTGFIENVELDPTNSLDSSNVRGTVSQGKIQCTFTAELPDTSARAAASFSLSVITGPYNATSGELGSPSFKILTSRVNLSDPSANVTNTLSNDTTTSSAYPVTVTQSFLPALLVTVCMVAFSAM